jgi:hypothetical protein
MAALKQIRRLLLFFLPNVRHPLMMEKIRCSCSQTWNVQAFQGVQTQQTQAARVAKPAAWGCACSVFRFSAFLTALDSWTDATLQCLLDARTVCSLVRDMVPYLTQQTERHNHKRFRNFRGCFSIQEFPCSLLRRFLRHCSIP